MTQNFKGIVRLSEENYLTLSTTGTLTLKDGSTLTFDPTSTLYMTPDSTIDFTQEDKDKVEIIDISGDGTQFLSNDGSYKSIESGIEQLVGTTETPINLYNDLEVNKLYLISGVIYNSDNNLTANDSILTYKTNTNSLYLIGGKIDLITNELSFQPNYFTVAEVEATGEISTHQSSIAPVNSGTPGQVLTSNGPDEAPTWQSGSSVNIDNTTITRNNSDSIQAVGLTNGSVNLTCDDIYDALASDWEV